MNLGTLLVLLEEQKRNSPQGDSTEVKFFVRTRFDVRRMVGSGTLGDDIAGVMAIDFAPALVGVRNDIGEIGNDPETGAVRLYIE